MQLKYLGQLLKRLKDFRIDKFKVQLVVDDLWFQPKDEDWEKKLNYRWFNLSDEAKFLIEEIEIEDFCFEQEYIGGSYVENLIIFTRQQQLQKIKFIFENY